MGKRHKQNNSIDKSNGKATMHANAIDTAGGFSATTDSGASTGGMLSRSLLDKIDQLFACNVGEHVALPQLVVIGDQSSGKSSALEGLTGLPFPKDSGLCTRFATQITFRRAKIDHIDVSIIAGQHCTKDHAEKVKAWKKDIESLSPEAFAEIIKEATTIMGVGDKDDPNSSTFSTDVLRVEILGPKQEHFSIIDVPGIFRRAIPGSTTKADITMVDTMVQGYMKNERSIMLVVVPAGADIATQEILERASDLDPDGIRTFGLVTKPDLMDKGSEQVVLDMIEGKQHQLRLGWHCLRNPGQADSSDGRSQLEISFFNTTAPWNTLDKDKVGSKALRQRLQVILEDHIRKAFPVVKQEIAMKLKANEAQLHALGPKRQNQAELMQYALKLAQGFQARVQEALDAQYSYSDIFKDESLRLATSIRNRSDAFAKDMRNHGHRYEFQTDLENADKPEPEKAEADEKQEAQIATRTILDETKMIDIEDLVEEHVKISKARTTGIMPWIKDVNIRSRGLGVGGSHDSVLEVLVQEQSTKWHDISQGYVCDVILMVHNFIVNVLDHLIKEEREKEAIKSILLDDIREQYVEAIDYAKLLLKIELKGLPATHNPEYNNSLEKFRRDRLAHDIGKQAMVSSEGQKVINIQSILSAPSIHSEDSWTYDMHDTLRAYYSIAVNRFIDNVRKQVCDYRLLIGPDSPLRLFSATFVAGLSMEQLENIVGEDYQVKVKRAKLEKTIAQLKDGKKIFAS